MPSRPNPLRRLWWLVLDLWRVLEPEHELYLDLRRVNDEERVARRAVLDEDLEYRARVKRRMLEGLTAQEMRPLVQRAEFLRRRRIPRNVASFPEPEKREVKT